MLRARELAYAYTPDLRAIDGVSLEARPGEMLGVIGPNGCGKSTLTRLMAGILRPDSGAALWRDVPLADLPPLERARRVAYLPQRVEAVGGWRCDEAVALGRNPSLGRGGFLSDADRAAVDEAMRRVGVTEFAARPLDQLSGGERQRVLIASILAQDTEALLLDEPTAALDLRHQHQTLTLLRALADEGRAVIVVLHDLNVAAQFCHRLALLSVGRVVALGPPAETLTGDKLSPVYGGQIAVAEHPMTGRPLVTVLTEEIDPGA